MTNLRDLTDDQLYTLLTTDPEYKAPFYNVTAVKGDQRWCFRLEGTPQGTARELDAMKDRMPGVDYLVEGVKIIGINRTEETDVKFWY